MAAFRYSSGFIVLLLNATGWKRLAINLFLVFHIVAITIWCVPIGSPLVAAIRGVVGPYLLWTGLFQSWDTFGPDPKSANSYIEALVISRDGRSSPWSFPRMERLTLAERYFRERYRKFVENLKEDQNSAMWPDTARRIAWLNKDHSNPPEIVILVRYWSEIIPDEVKSSRSEPWHAQIFYEYSVRPEDLK